MKIKKFNNLWTMGVVLAIGLLVGIYVLKFAFPELVIEIAEIPSVCRIGHYIDNHKWAWYLASGVLSYITLYFYCAACCGKKFLNIKDNILLIIMIIISYIVKQFLPNQYLAFNVSIMIFVPYLMHAKFKNVAIIFPIVNIVQTFTLEIRGLNTMIADYNFASFLILLIDYYILQILLYLLFNNKNYEKGV